MVEIKPLAEKIIDILHEEEEKRGLTSLPVTALYKALGKDASFDDVQRALTYLLDRDLVAPFSYSLTAKGRRERSLRSKT